MDDNIRALLEYLNLPPVGKFIISPTTFYLLQGSWLISPEAYGVRITTTSSTRIVRDMKAYALLMRVIGDSKHIVPHMEEVIESLIRQVANCTMDKFSLTYDVDEACVEVNGFMVRHISENGEAGQVDSRHVWRIDTKAKTLHRYTPNQWMFESSTRDVGDYYNDIGACLILLNAIKQHKGKHHVKF